MIKRGKSRFISSLCILQIFLIVSFVFAFSFVMNAGIVSGQDENISEFNRDVGSPGIQTGIEWATGPGKIASPAPTSSTGLNLRIGKAETITEYVSAKDAEAIIANINGKPTEIAKLKSTIPLDGKNPIWGAVTKDGETINIPSSEAEKLLSDGTIKKSTSSSSSGFLGGIFGATPFGLSGTAAHLTTGLIWGATAALIGKLAGGLFGLDKQQSNALSLSLFGGVFTYRSLSQGLLGEGFLKSYALPIGIGVGVAIFLFMYKKESKKLVTFQCLPWEPPIGGNSCEKCNKDPLRLCSEYRCKSLGQACQILNPGTQEERCAWVNPGDVNSPTITPWKDALKPIGLLNYIPDTTIRPPNRGVKIIDSRNSNGCLEPFTPLEFGVELNEPAQCKIDFNRNNTFANMQYYFGENNLYRYNHTQKMRLPAPKSELLGTESPLLQNDNTMSLFARCQDANGNVNEDAFVFTFCVDESPDTTPPIIEGTSIIQNGAVQFNIDKVPIDVYTNEPAICKWSRGNKAYEEMENSMTCNTDASAVNANLQYTCNGELTGIANQQNNDFYFRCQDTEGNTNVQSYKLTLRGSQELNIISASPNNETVSGATTTVPIALQVKTDDGADEGIALCYFSNTGTEGSYIPMFNTNSFEHSQSLDLINGDYTYHFRCVDAGGNSAETSIKFKVFVDKEIPKVVRAYKDLDALKIVTDENAQCVYSLNNCNYVFDEGNALLYSNPNIKRNHFAEWNTKNTYYIKCRDEKGNEPSPNSCSIVINAVNL